MSSDRLPPRFIPPAEVPPPASGEEPIVWFEMPSGLQVGLRPLHPDDRQALMEGFRTLSEESRYHRFLSPMPRLSDRHARYLTELDQIDHFAWGIGIRGDGGAIEGIGVARYVRETGDRGTAEVAVAITDPYHGLGLGTLAVRALAVVAATRGIEVLTGYLLGDNKPMARIFEGMGATFTPAGPGLLRAVAVLRDESPGTLGDEACTELIRVAGRASHPSVTAIPTGEGEVADVPGRLPPTPGGPMEVGNISCRQCGREIDDSLTWCPYCGAEQRPGETVPLASAEIAAELETDAQAASADPVVPTDWSGGALPADAARSGPSRAMIIALGLLVLVGAAAAWFFLIRDDHRGPISLFDIAAGDCWDDPSGESGDGGLATVPEVPCDDPHAYEVFAVADLPGAEGAAYPGDEAAGIDGAQLCRDRFEAFVGVPYDESPLESSVLFPTADSWAAGDREVICSAYALDGSSLTGTIRASGDRLLFPAVDTAGAADCPGLADLTITVAQGFIDFYDGLTPEEAESGYEVAPPEMVPVLKSESLLVAAAEQLGCGFEDLNTLFVDRAGALTSSTEVGAMLEQDYRQYGYFPTG